MTRRRDELAARILRAVEAGPEAPLPDFEALALDVFEYQYEHNEPYRTFCVASEKTPASVDSWLDVPAYPTQAFKQEIVTSFPMSEAVMAQLTSGTTRANQRGRIYRDELGKQLVFAANRAVTGTYLFPDHESERCRILFLAPSPEMAPSMGMAIGMEQTRRAFGTKDSQFLLKRTGVDVAGLSKALREAEDSGRPVAIVGATSAFIYFLQACVRKGISFRLPERSRLIDGGGYRGRFGEVTRDDYYEMVADRLGVSESMCANTLGMAESATNYSDRTILDALSGQFSRSRRKATPSWTRVVAIDPDTAQPLPHGAVGLLRHIDVVNLPTVVAVQSDNLGFTDEDGSFEIIGRARVVDGKVSQLPSERAVGPMGDRRVFRLLEAYVNFSIDFKMGHLDSKQPKTSYTELRETQEVGKAKDEGEAVLSCPTVVEEIVAGADDPEAARRAQLALETFEKRVEHDHELGVGVDDDVVGEPFPESETDKAS